jgi:hypothetical protein
MAGVVILVPAVCKPNVTWIDDWKAVVYVQGCGCYWTKVG